MADSEYDVEVESDDSDLDDYVTSSNNAKYSKPERRARRNALEWKRRAKLRECLMDVKTVVPSLQGKKNASNAVIVGNLNQYSREWKGRIRQMWRDIQKLQRKYNIPLKQLMTEKLEARDRNLAPHIGILTTGRYRSDRSGRPVIRHMQLSNAEIIEWSHNIGITHSFQQDRDGNKDARNSGEST